LSDGSDPGCSFPMFKDIPKQLGPNRTKTINKTRNYYETTAKTIENVAINNVLPLKAARPDAIANVKCFGTLFPR